MFGHAWVSHLKENRKKNTHSTAFLTSWESQYLYFSEGEQNFCYLHKREKLCKSAKKGKKKEKIAATSSTLWVTIQFLSQHPGMPTDRNCSNSLFHWQTQNWRDLVLQPCYSNAMNVGGLLRGKKNPHFLGEADSGEHSHQHPKIVLLKLRLEIPIKQLLQQTRTRTSSIWLLGTSTKCHQNFPFP